VWLEEMHDFKAASQMYIAANEPFKAVQIMGQNGWIDDLVDLTRKLTKADSKVLQACAEYFRQSGNHQQAKEMYTKLGDVRAVMQLHVELEKWDEAMKLAERHPEFKNEIYLPYADWLATNDRFDEAQVAYQQAGRPDRSIKMLNQLTHNAVIENRFKDAAYYYWRLGMETAKLIKSPYTKLTEADQRNLERFRECIEKAELYYAYHFVYRYTEEPFTSLLPEPIFNIARYLVCCISKRRLAKSISPFGVSEVNIIYALAKQGKHLEAYKLARHAFDKLQALKIPAAWIDQIDLASVTIRARPFSDREDLLPVCYRCSSTNPLLNQHGDSCISCQHVFVRSFVSFENLPVVQFVLADGIEDDEALKLINEDSATASWRRPKKPASSWKTSDTGGMPPRFSSEHVCGMSVTTHLPGCRRTDAQNGRPGRGRG
jgi:intraflagellar transport protein 122